MWNELALNFVYAMSGVATGLGLWFGFLALVQRSVDKQNAKKHS